MTQYLLALPVAVALSIGVVWLGAKLLVRIDRAVTRRSRHVPQPQSTTGI